MLQNRSAMSCYADTQNEGRETRTPNLLIWSQPRYQLRHKPVPYVCVSHKLCASARTFAARALHWVNVRGSHRTSILMHRFGAMRLYALILPPLPEMSAPVHNGSCLSSRTATIIRREARFPHNTMTLEESSVVSSVPYFITMRSHKSPVVGFEHTATRLRALRNSEKAKSSELELYTSNKIFVDIVQFFLIHQS